MVKMESIPESTNDSNDDTTPTVTGAPDSVGSTTTTPGEAGEIIAAIPETENLHNPGAAGDATEQSSSDSGQVSDESSDSDSDSKLTTAGGEIQAAPGPSVSTPTTKADLSVGQPSDADPATADGASIPTTTTAAPTPKATGTWSLLEGLFQSHPAPAPTPTTPASTVNNQVDIQAPASATGNQSQQSSQPLTYVRKRPRKNAASAKNVMKRKRVLPTIIDDRIALEFLKELKMTRGFLQQGKLLAWTLQPDDIDFINIHDYVSRSQGGKGVTIITILRVVAQTDALHGENSPPLSFSQDPNTAGKFRMMLWHGTKPEFVASILENGLVIPPGRRNWFGSGIYFGDRISTSINYCLPSSEGYSYLFLCDVLLGNVYKAYSLMMHLKKAPTVKVKGRGMVTYDSVLGCGTNVPDDEWNMKIDGCTWPLGHSVQTPALGTANIVGNEYVVFDTKHVQPKYLLKVQRTTNPVHDAIY